MVGRQIGAGCVHDIFKKDEHALNIFFTAFVVFEFFKLLLGNGDFRRRKLFYFFL